MLFRINHVIKFLSFSTLFDFLFSRVEVDVYTIVQFRTDAKLCTLLNFKLLKNQSTFFCYFVPSIGPRKWGTYFEQYNFCILRYMKNSSVSKIKKIFFWECHDFWGVSRLFQVTSGLYRYSGNKAGSWPFWWIVANIFIEKSAKLCASTDEFFDYFFPGQFAF